MTFDEFYQAHVHPKAAEWNQHADNVDAVLSIPEFSAALEARYDEVQAHAMELNSASKQQAAALKNKITQFLWLVLNKTLLSYEDVLAKFMRDKKVGAGKPEFKPQFTNKKAFGQLQANDRDEILQEWALTVQQLWQDDGKGPNHSNIPAWLHVVLYNKIREFPKLSKNRSIALIEDPDKLATDKKQVLELSVEIEWAFETLTNEEKTVQELRHQYGMTFQEISDELQMPLTTIYARYKSGMEKMRKHLGGEGH